LADTSYILEVSGNQLQSIATTYGLTVQKQVYSSSAVTIGVVTLPTGVDPTPVSQDPNVLKFVVDQFLPGNAPVSPAPSISAALTNLEAFFLSIQNSQQQYQSYSTQHGLKLTGVPFGTKGNGVVVAVIDTAVDTNHPLLAGKLLPAVDCVSNGSTSGCNGTVTSIWGDPQLDQSTVVILDQSTVVILDQSTVVILDQSTVVILDQSTVVILDGKKLPADMGHGTMVSTLIAAAAPKAQILPIRAFNADGSADLGDVIAAIRYAVDNGANVINASFDIPTDSDALSDVIEYANSKGVIVVASAANQNNNTPVFPAAYNGLALGVGSVDSLTGLFKSSFSQFGQPSVNAYAPGEGLIAGFPGGYYAVVSGTSFSAALASGAAATVLSNVNNNVSPISVVNALTSDGPYVLMPSDGTHRINAKSAIKSLN
jgi:subtilisin family serine protease